MINNIDLHELAKRESERVEWKENVADITNVIKTIVAFANDYSNLGGGYVVCGAKEGKDVHGFQKLRYLGLTATRMAEITGKVLTDCITKVDPKIVPRVEELPVPDDDSKRILVFIVPATNYAHSYRSNQKDASTYYIRSGSNTIEARNGLLRELLIRKQQIEPWDRRINPQSRFEHIDLIIFRDYLQEMGLWSSNKALEDYISDKEKLSDFTPPLAGKIGLDSTLRLKNFAILMFAKKPLDFFYGAYSIFSTYPGTDRSEPTGERKLITGTIVQQARRLIDLLNAESYTVFDKTTDTPNQVKYSSIALKEAVVNALVHRDYESDQPVRVTIFVDRIEIYSPGGLPIQVDKEQFKAGKATAYWRNQALNYLFNRLQLAQAEGQGIPTILRAMREEGCPEPIFDIAPESVTCILPAHPRQQILRARHKLEK
jgi:ATP-dependent DNA helicase RecG